MTKNETRTASVLQRVPRILEVTAHSYGLSLQARKPGAAGDRHGLKCRKSAHDGKPVAGR